MKIEVESVSPVERKVTIEVDPDRVAKELDLAYVGLGRRVKLRGFRPGKAPRKVLERHFRSEVESEVAEKIVQATFAEAVRVEDLDIVAPAARLDLGGRRPGQAAPVHRAGRGEAQARAARTTRASR